MKKFLSVILAVIMVFSAQTIVLAEETVSVVSISLVKSEYYEAIEVEEKVRDSVKYVEFTATMSDGTEINYNSEDGWSNGATYQVSAYIQNETDEDFGVQQSLYITIDGQDFWAGYTEVEVNCYKAILRRVVTLDGRSEEIKDRIYCWADNLATGFLSFVSEVELFIYETIISIVHLITG